MFDTWTMQSPVPAGVNRRLCSSSCYIIYGQTRIIAHSQTSNKKMYVCEGETTPVKAASRITLNSGDQTLNLFLME
jgi:hypothetical protein